MGSARANVVFVASAVAGLAVFTAIILIGNDGGLSWVRFGAATAAFLVVAPGGAWATNRILLK